MVTKSTPVSKMFPRRQPSLLRTTGPKGGALGLGPAGAGECASLHFSRIVNVDGGQPAGSLEGRKAEAVAVQRKEPHNGEFTGGLAGDGAGWVQRRARGGGSVRAFPVSGRVSLGCDVAKRAEAREAGQVQGP